MTKLPPELEAFDWSVTTWEGSRREQLRRWAQLPLERVIAAIEEMERLSETLHAESADGGIAPPSRTP
jgi:hypothetical protein